tara:strand:- start:52 stop:159 length:108 start_codon:yes stop_codon:yes gene_type:complete
MERFNVTENEVKNGSFFAFAVNSTIREPKPTAVPA